ncbi:transposase family protein [Kitasatospora sp. NPDC127067]|uniref:transposase family protein n=1 Tax=Kitasatospora sp. NPDC127067 TaxID=3347126 RepID=UPI00364A5A0C
MARRVAVPVAAPGGGLRCRSVRCGGADRRPRAPGASCPDCGTWSERVHRSYLRYPSDLPSCGQPVTVALRVHRFACQALVCQGRRFRQRRTRDR